MQKVNLITGEQMIPDIAKWVKIQFKKKAAALRKIQVLYRSLIKYKSQLKPFLSLLC